jgi:hypothetical protein
MILNSPYISGSLTVTGNTNLIGALTVTGSLAGTATSSSFAYTASSAVSAYTAASAVNATTALTASYATSFTVGGTLTAQTLVVQTITSSVSFITGSTRFGSLLTNTHDFTGSVRITGSLTVNTTGTEFQVTNNGVVMGNLLADSHSVTGSLRVTGSGTFTSTISAIGESTLFQGAYNDPVPNTVAVLKMSSIPTPSLASTVVGARMSGNATANVDTYAGYFSNISTVSGTGLSYGIFATASFHTFIGETRFAQGVFNDPINGTVASIKISATPRSGAPTAVFTTGITGTASSGQNTFAGYFTNTSTVSGGGVNYGIYATGSNHFFGGNVGIGTSSPLGSATERTLHLSDGGAGFTTLYVTNGANTLRGIFAIANAASSIAIGSQSNHDFRIVTNDIERMRLNQYGQLLINATSSAYSTNLFGYNLGVRGTNNQTFISIARANQTLDTQGIIFGLDTATAFLFVHDNIPLTLSTNGAERMRITSGGNVLIGTTSAGTDFTRMSCATTGANVLGLVSTDNSSGAGFLICRNSATTLIGDISRVGTTNAVAFNTTSDYRLKEDLKEIKGLEKLSHIKVYDFKWKDNDARMDGVIAHELQEVLPYAVHGEKDGKEMQGVDYSKLVPILVKSIQELKAELDELKNK